MTLTEMQTKITELQNKEARIKERLAMTNEQLQQMFGTTDPVALNTLLNEKKARETVLSAELQTKMTELSTILAGC